MNNQSIAVIDSGFGGISVLHELVKSFPTEHFIYFGDNDNAPYGNLSKHNLLRLVIKSIDLVKGYNPKGIVLACNTLSVNLFNQIKEYSGLPTFCTFPPVEKCKLENKNTLLLATERTAKNYSASNNLDVVGLKDLALIIERNILNLHNFNFSDYFATIDKANNLKGHYETVILGCTHYNFIKKQIFVHFRPQNFYSGTENLIKMMKKVYRQQKSLVKNNRFGTLFIGNNARLNEYIYNVCGQQG